MKQKGRKIGNIALIGKFLEEKRFKLTEVSWNNETFSELVRFPIDWTEFKMKKMLADQAKSAQWVEKLRRIDWPQAKLRKK